MRQALTIRPAPDGGLDFDLADLLRVLGPRVGAVRWRCDVGQYVSWDDQAIREFDHSQLIRGEDLLAAADNVRQIIDGEFEAFDDEGLPWVLLRAVDSSWWDVETADPSVLKTIADQFPTAERRPLT
jgi:hypothetical protein